MNIILLDANAVLRYLANDLPEQTERVARFLVKASRSQLIIVVTPEVLVEVIFHLINWYKVAKPVACENLTVFLSSEYIKMEHKKQALEALSLYKEKNIDLVDLLLWTKAKEENMKILSFDKDFDKLQPNLKIEF